MIYLIADTEKQSVTLVVKAENEVEFQDRVTLKNTERICGRFTDSYMEILNSSPFVVISV